MKNLSLKAGDLGVQLAEDAAYALGRSQCAKRGELHMVARRARARCGRHPCQRRR